MFNKKNELIIKKDEEITSLRKQLKLAQSNFEILNSQIIEMRLKIDVLEDLNVENENLKRKVEECNQKYSVYIEHKGLYDKEIAELENIKNLRIEYNEKYKKDLVLYNELNSQLKLFKDELEIGEFGLYEPNFGFQTSEEFKSAIRKNYSDQKELIQTERAIILMRYPSNEIVDLNDFNTVDKTKFLNTKKMILYAFNAECDSLISKVNWNNIYQITERIYNHWLRISKYSLGLYHYDRSLNDNRLATWNITDEYLNLKIEEAKLNYEYKQKKNEEKEEQKRIREQIREEEKALRDYEKAEKDAEEEEKYLQKALEKVKEKFGYVTPSEVDALNLKVLDLENRIKEAQEKKERAIALAQTTKVGYIYVISNIGTFGENVYKIGMTRRLDPQDRVDELSNASVPFKYDIHAVIFSENAPQLEYEIHQRLSDKRINLVNRRKEFFNVKLEEIVEIIKEHTDAEVHYTKIAEAREFRESLTMAAQLLQSPKTINMVSNFPDSLFE